MSMKSLVQRQRDALARLTRLMPQRVEAERSATAKLRGARTEAQAALDRSVAEIESQFAAERRDADARFGSSQIRIAAQLETERRGIERHCDAAIERLRAELDGRQRQAQKALDEAHWLARTVYEAQRKRSAQRWDKAQKQLARRRELLASLRGDAEQWLAEHRQRPNVAQAAEASAPDRDEKLYDRLVRAQERAEQALARLKSLRLPALAQGMPLFWIVVLIAGLSAAATGWIVGFRAVPWIATTGISTALVAGGVWAWLRVAARRQASIAFGEFTADVTFAEDLCQQCLTSEEATWQRRRNELKQNRQDEMDEATAAHAPTIERCQDRRAEELPQLTADADRRLIECQANFDQQARAAEQARDERLTTVQAQRNAALAEAQNAHRAAMEVAESRFQQDRAAYEQQWRSGFDQLRAELAEIQARVAVACPEWERIASGGWSPPRELPPAIAFGRISRRLADATKLADVPEFARTVRDERLELPALLDFPERASVYIKANGTGRQRAVDLLQVVMLRMLTSAPPGKVRFTIVDSAGLGQNFAAFMHLADHDEALVGHRIWTEPSAIEQRLTDVTEHMETIIQKYLRNEFPTIQAYNREAGEIAEPLRVVVVANFPAGFSEAAARRLISIAASGPRCGVHVLVSVDTKLPPLAGVDLADLQRHASIFVANGDGIAWQDPDFQHLTLAPDPSPGESIKAIVQAVGAAAVATKRVEVPFESIAPPEERYWTFDSRRGVDVPLGRAGATRLQHLRLGQGTAQHVLIAGKTGSGKSTLLHALILNAALHYSPEELELYLIDFKKGVEFKTYVTHELPHARVVAIESEREFGLSVMQRLDAEMRERGDRFRAEGVQDIAGYRDAGFALPRILLVVDEFQEFFVQDDKLAQEASLLLDRLVRQGRAFGIHVHLGSQTLCGAYSLARSTLGQMAVRIALQCSEADAQVILSEDNPAARLLSRPGEAIYNDANGLVEGNHLFQVVWLPDDRREVYLNRLAALAGERRLAVRPRMVFEGNRPADLEPSLALRQLLESEPTAFGPTKPEVVLGEPLSLQAATSLCFARRGGANLFWLGQNSEAVAGMAAASIVSLAAQQGVAVSDDASGPMFRVLVDEGAAEWGSLRTLARELPRHVRIGSANEAAEIVAEVAAIVAQRQTSGVSGRAIFLTILDLARFRELRHTDDEFSFSRSRESEPPRPDRQLAEILREGPSLGVHVLLWCDSLANFHRMLDRQALREFESRVLLQMSATDSSMLTDLPAASQLGRTRALLQREDEGTLQKFRPFAAPTSEWLHRTCKLLATRMASPPGPTAPLAVEESV